MSEFVEFKGEKLSTQTFELMEVLSREMPNITFGYEMQSYRTGKEYSTGIYRKLNVYDGKMMIGEIGDSNCNPHKYYVASPNIKQGRYHYQIGMSDAKMKQSIHIKEVLKVAKKALTPLTYQQAMEESYNNYRRNMQNFAWDKQHNIKNHTYQSYDLIKDDAVALFKQGVQFTNSNLTSAIKYIAENKEYCDKYWQYDPKQYGVWVTDRGVQYCLKGEGEIKSVATKADLPEALLGKVCMLDIMEARKFVEDMGYKENDQCYWVIE